MVPVSQPWCRRVLSLPPPPLLIALGLSTILFVAALGLRARILLLGLLPPAAGLVLAARLAQRHRHQAMLGDNPGGPESLLDPEALARRLSALARAVRGSSSVEPPLSPVLWRQRSERLEEIRSLALSWAQRDAHATVDLLVLLEELLDRLPQPCGDGALDRDLERVRDQLASSWSPTTLPPRSRP